MATDEKREAIIRVENFKAAYDGQVVLDHVNFEVYAGEVLRHSRRLRLAARAPCSNI